MSRSQHSRPAPNKDTLSRVTQAAISAADTFKRFERDMERLSRAVEAAGAEGIAQHSITFAVSQAGRGRPDRAAALRTIAARAAAAQETHHA